MKTKKNNLMHEPARAIRSTDRTEALTQTSYGRDDHRESLSFSPMCSSGKLAGVEGRNPTRQGAMTPHSRAKRFELLHNWRPTLL